MAKKAGGASGKLTYYFGTTGATAEATKSSCWAARARTSPDMTSIGLPVPPGFTITTDTLRRRTTTTGSSLPKGLMDEVQKNDRDRSRRRLGQEVRRPDGNPLLVSRAFRRRRLACRA
jgi:pyruvate,orthophosphate dikinase